MITLSLLHPIKQIPVQVWTFDNESTIRIGRSTDNQVILYSAVVSRHHVELRRVGEQWEIINLGTNGTYLDGKRITQVPVADGAVIRLARSGPNIKIRLGEEALKEIPEALVSDRTVSQRSEYPMMNTEITHQHHVSSEANSSPLEPEPSEPPPPPTGTIPVPPHLQLVDSLPPPLTQSNLGRTSTAIAAPPPRLESVGATLTECNHRQDGSLFCPDCGQPLQVLQTVGDYELVKVLGQGDIGVTYLSWRSGENLVVKTLNPDWAADIKAHAAFECEAEILRQLNHPRIPHFIDFFSFAGQPYLAMEMKPGQSLLQRVSAEGNVSVSQAIAWVLEVCSVLDYLHSFVPPILHRGIKPNALIRQPSPHQPEAIALVDFGTVKSVILGKESAAGSKGYNAPEQMELDATPAADLYSLAPLLAYLLTGQNPIAFYSDRTSPYRFDPTLIPNLPSHLIPILHKLTHPQPERRYGSAQEVAIALQQARD